MPDLAIIPDPMPNYFWRHFAPFRNAATPMQDRSVRLPDRRWSVQNLQLLGQFLRAHRLRAGLSQRQLARQCKVGTRTIGRLELAQIADPRHDTLLRLAKCLDIAWADIASFLIEQPTDIDKVVALAASVPPDLLWVAEGVLRLLAAERPKST